MCPGGVAETQGTNVLLITIDTLRAGRLGAYGYAAAQTPAMDRLALGHTTLAEIYDALGRGEDADAQRQEAACISGGG